ncbi:MAG: N-acyl-D-amino-acid deacylase family protein [Promethearchaeia archaeon]
MDLDILIKNAFLVNGLGEKTPYKPWVKKNIGIKEEKIVKIGENDISEANETINADGLIASPGFIDIHSHSDPFLVRNSKAESKIRQGVTTEVTGNCGLSVAPIEGGIKSRGFFPKEAELKNRSMNEYMRKLEDNGVSVNVAPLVGHGNIREKVMGHTLENPSKKELNEMKELLRKNFKHGVWGMSTGLIYPPGSFAETNEIRELCKIVEAEDGVHHAHIRGQGGRMISAIKEVLNIVKETDVSLHILHHKGMGDNNASKVKYTLSMIDDLITEGKDITLDMYPYTVGQGGLAMFLPSWVQEGGSSKLVERLKDSENREKLKRQMREPQLIEGYQSYASDLGWEKCWDHIIICRASENEELAGKSIAEAKPKGQDPAEFVFDLLIQEGGEVTVIIPDMIDIDDKYLQMVLRHPNCMFGSDGYALAPYGEFSEGLPHPRSYGAFPKVLSEFIRERRLFSWEEGIRKMTSLPAQFLGIENRGIIKEGYYADIVLFDPKTVLDKATFMGPHKYPEGINYVIVNGTITIKDGKHTGALTGKVLRK